MRSNLSVGVPLDLLVHRKDCFTGAKSYRITADDPYFMRIRMQWAAGLHDCLLHCLNRLTPICRQSATKTSLSSLFQAPPDFRAGCLLLSQLS